LGQKAHSQQEPSAADTLPVDGLLLPAAAATAAAAAADADAAPKHHRLATIAVHSPQEPSAAATLPVDGLQNTHSMLPEVPSYRQEPGVTLSSSQPSGHCAAVGLAALCSCRRNPAADEGKTCTRLPDQVTVC
jgi:hypothetical protein